MRKLFFLLIFFMLYQSLIYGQLFSKNQKFRIFTVDLKATEVVGNKKFNDLGIKHFTSVIDDLTDDTSTYLWRLGTIRLNTLDYTDGSISLFNLSTANHIGGYPILDSIDFTFYRERGFQILENKEPPLLANVEYIAFKDTICNTSKTLFQRRNYLWLESNKHFRDKLIGTRYFINNQPITLNQKLTKKVTAELKTVLKTDLDNLLKIASNIKDTVTNQKVDSVGLSAYFNKTINKTVDLKGSYLSVVFQGEYINRAKYIIERMTNNDPLILEDNEFNNNLKFYIPKMGIALNSAIFAFKFNGGLDKRLVSVDSIKSELSALFNISSKQAGTLATNANFMFSRHLDETYNNQFSKVWLIMFGTDEILDKLRFSNGQVINRNPKKK